MEYIVKHSLPPNASNSFVAHVENSLHKPRMGKLLGDALRSAREQKNLRQTDVARELGVSRAAVGQWEAGTTEPSTANLLKVCDLLEISLGAASAGVVKFVPLEPGVTPPAAPQKLGKLPDLRIWESEQRMLFQGEVPRDIPVMGAAYGGSDGEFLLNGEIIDYARRPPGLQRTKGVYAVFITGTSMSPRFDQGDIVYVNPNQPPAIGDDVVMQMKQTEEGAPIRAFIKRLTRRTGLVTHLEQFNPPGEIQVENESILALHRVVLWRELLGV